MKAKKFIFGILPIWLAIIGAINWGLVGLVDFNLVTAILGSIPWLVTIVYILVGISGIILIWKQFK